MIHEIFDTIALIAAILALIPLWREEKRKLIAITFSCLLIVGGGYIWWNYYQERQEERSKLRDIDDKERQIKDLLCDHGADFEEISQTTSFGYSDEILNDALDDMMQKKHSLLAPEVTARIAGPPARDVPIRIFQISSKEACQTPASLSR